MSACRKSDAVHHDENSAHASTSEIGSEPTEAISFAEVVRMTHEQASEPGALLQALRASPERTRNV